MVGDETTAAQPTLPAAKRRGGDLRHWFVVAAGIVAILVLLRGGASLLSGVASASRPGGTEQSVSLEQGKRLYGDDCASCHGSNGDRVAAAPLNSKEFTENLGPRLEQAISNGKGTMAAWGRDRGGPMSSNDVKSVAEYVRNGKEFSAVGVAVPATRTTTPTVAPTVEQTRTPPAIPHLLPDQASRCLDCHGKSGQRPMPVNHAGRTNSSCALCHAQSPAAPVQTAVPAATSVAATPQR